MVLMQFIYTVFLFGLLLFYSSYAAELAEKTSDNNQVQVSESGGKQLDEPQEPLYNEWDVENWMVFTFGSANNDKPIIIYVTPSCLHCGQFLVTELDKFLKQYGQQYKVIVKFILSNPDDIFILKLFRNKFLQTKTEPSVKSTVLFDMFNTYVNFMEFFNAKCRGNPRGADIRKIAEEFQFSDKDVADAKPDPNGIFEKKSLPYSIRHSKEILKITKTEAIGTPCMVYGEKCVDGFTDIEPNYRY